MNWFNGIASVTVAFCLYKSLADKGQKRVFRIGKWMLVGGFLSLIGLTLWSAVFYILMAFPLEGLRPWSILLFIDKTGELDGLTTFYLWCLPLLGLVCANAILLAPFFEPSFRHLYGNAHWASRREIKKMGFFNEQGNVIVGQYAGKLLHYTLTNHMLVFAPSRSGKGVSVVIPNALNWQGSLVVMDNKYEVFNATSGYRERQGNQVFRFSPASSDFKTHRINPLDYVNRDNPYKRIADLHLILDILIASSGDENKMWIEEARSLALGLLLWLMQSKRLFALSELSSIVKGGNLEDFLAKVIESHTIAANLISLDPTAYLDIQNFLQKAPKEQSGVRSTLTAMLRLWEDPLICAATNHSDIDFKFLRKKPITLYLSFGTDQISRLSPLINLLVQFFLNVMLSHLPKRDEPYKVLCLLDEFNRFGRMDKLKDGFGDLAGYGVHLMPIIQNLGQFYSLYGGRDATDIFLQNTDLKIAFRQNAPTDKEFLSKEVGTRTVRIKNRSYATSREGSNYSESLIERPLLSPAEVGRLPAKQQIIITGEGVVRCKKIVFYKDKRFKSKLLPAVGIPAVTPQFPVIEVIKEGHNSINEAVTLKSKGPQAALIGEAITSSLRPLVHNVRYDLPPVHLQDDVHLLNELSNAFEDEGV
ncbi:type IV secretory system conjugative DNA transfer family protein [Legionella feeleii]|uniref:Protein LvhD4 n=1 Tax=Legionella feeleii TaxID=453 RepID=A0A378IVV2_9GAMM|nr:type IV secretory system conjugative DNA transfer family protein [Legionella feeleii]STX39289.1 protein LvhD4 [Legionella feeleii]